MMSICKKKIHVRSFKTFLDKYLINNGFISFCGQNKLGKVYFDQKIHNSNAFPHMYNLLVEKYRNKKEADKQKSRVRIQDMNSMFKEQCSKFPTTSEFDYRILIKDGILDEDKFNTYFNPELVQLIGNLTKSEISKTAKHSQLYSDMRIYMIISLLCYVINPSTVFIQTIIGLFCYAYGLNDKGFEILNAFGCSCSVDHVRRHGEYWASKRCILDELNKKIIVKGII